MSPKLTEDQVNALAQLFYTDGIQLGVHAMYEKVSEKYPNLQISRRQVGDWLKKQEIYQINLPTNQVKVKHFGVAVHRKLLENVQIDLIDYSNKPARQFNYILTFIDSTSRYAFAKRITTKSAKTTLQAFKEIEQYLLERDYPKIKIVQTDEGGEWKGVFGSYMAERGYRHLLSNVSQHQGRVERFNRTIRRILDRLVQQKGRSWADHIARAVQLYNRTYHSVIKEKPFEVFNNYSDEELDELYEEMKARSERIQKENNANVPESVKDIINVGDAVRILKPKNLLEKKSVNNWSKSVYYVRGISKSKGVLRFHLEDADTGKKHKRSMYREELQLIKDIENKDLYDDVEEEE